MGGAPAIRARGLLIVVAATLAACPESSRPGQQDLEARSEARPTDGPRPADTHAAPDTRAPAPDSTVLDPSKTYWVSPSGAAAWTSCRGKAPLSGATACSLATANTSAAPGDTIFLRAGTYGTGIAPAKSGTASARITYWAYSGEQVLITGIATGIALANRSYVIVDGVKVESCKVFADLQTADHIWILKSTLIKSSETVGWPVGVKMYNDSHHNRIAGCTIGEVGYQTSSDDIGGVMNVGNWQNASDTTGYNLFEDNTFYRGGHHIVEIASTRNVFRRNTFHNENWASCPRSSTGNLCGNRDIGLYRDELDGTWNVLEENRFAFAGASIDDFTGSSGLSVRNRNTIVRRNLFYLNDGPGLHLYVDSTKNYEASYTYAYHNVFYKNGVSPLSASTVRATYGLLFENSAGNSAPIPIVGVAVKNNLFYSDTGGSIFFYYTDPTKQAVLGNYLAKVYGSNASGYFTPALPATNVLSSADPLFVDISAAATVANIEKLDFHLKSGSPAIDKGVFLTTTQTAGSGTAIVVADAAYFIDGYGIVDGDTIQLQGQTQTARIVSIDYTANRLTVNQALTWTAGQGVGLAYKGSAPDIGAFEQ